MDWSEDLARIDDSDSDSSPEQVKLENRYSSQTVSTINLFDERMIPYELIIRLLEKICFEDTSLLASSAATLIFMPGLGEIRRLHDQLVEHTSFGDPAKFKLHPLHSALTTENQSAVFDVPAPGVRKVVIGT